MGPCGAQFLPFSPPLFFFFSSLFFFFRFFFYKRRRFIGPEPPCSIYIHARDLTCTDDEKFVFRPRRLHTQQKVENLGGLL